MVKKILKKIISVNLPADQSGVTLFLAIVILSSILAISFSLATILFVELRNSSDLLRTEPAISSASAVGEEAVFKIKRAVPSGSFSYTTNIGNVYLANPVTTTLNDPIVQDKVAATSNSFANTTNIYNIYDPSNISAGSGYGKIEITYIDTGNPYNLSVYICQYDPTAPSNPGDTLPICSDPGTGNSYWLTNNTTVTPSTPLSNRTWLLDPTKQQQLILVNNGGNATMYVQIATYGAGPSFAPKGIPYFGQQAVDITANSAGVVRKIRVLVPNGTNTSSGGSSSSTPPTMLILAGTGSSYSDSLGRAWCGDTSCSNLNISQGFGDVYNVSESISGTSDPVIYQNERWGDFTYTISGLTPGSSHTVVLKFSENYWGVPSGAPCSGTCDGDRVFNVAINGSTVLSNFDVFVAAGNAVDTAVDRSFSGIVADGSGQIIIQFSTITDAAKVNGVEIY